MTKPMDQAYILFRFWLDRVTTIDHFEFADWLRENFAYLAVDMEDGWTQDDVATFLRERFVSEKRINICPRRELQS